MEKIFKISMLQKNLCKIKVAEVFIAILEEL